MTTLAVTTVDLARAQFATTSLYHFLFVPLTLGLTPLVAIMQTAWYRTGVDAWLRLTKFFGALLLINFAIGVATGLVQEFQFGMNWSVYSAYVGGVFGAPLAIEGLAAFFLEATFLGLWIFGWDRLSPRVHLTTIWLVAAGTWMSAYFILVANSWMQHPVGSKVVDGEAQLTNVWDLLTSRFALYAFTHTMFVGVTTGALVVLGVSCWHLARGRNVDVFRRAAALALIVAVPATIGNMIVGSSFATASTDYQPMKIAAAEALWNTEQPAAFSLFQIGGFSVDDQKPSFDIEVPHLLSILATGTWSGKVEGLNPLQQQEQGQFGPGNYMPPVEPRVLGHARDGVHRRAHGARRARRGVAVPHEASRTRPLVPVDGGRGDRVPVHRGDGRVGAHRDRTPAVDRLGPPEDVRGQLAERQLGDARNQPRRVLRALRDAGRRRRRPHAALRPARPAVRAAQRGSPGAGDELLT